MITTVKSSMGCIAFVLLLHVTIFVTHSPVLFVSAKLVRGSTSNEIPIYGLPQRELKPAKEDKNKNKDKKEVVLKADKKDNRNGIVEIETNQPGSANNEDLGRDDVESIVASSVENSENILESGPAGDGSEDVNDGDQLSDIENSDNISESGPAGDGSEDVNTANHDGDQLSDIEYDKTKFVAGERLLPIVFNMTVSKFTNTINYDALKSHFKDIIEDVLDMKSNLDWYPYHSKLMHNISVQLIPSDTLTEGINEEQSVDHTIPVQMIINGLVFVHVNEQGVGIVTSTTRNAGGAKQQPEDVVNDSAIRSTFHDSFDHSMLLYFTFWGVDSLQEVLEEDGGVQKPVIDSVSVGDKQLITIDKDGNYFAYMDEGDGPSNSFASETSKFEKDSSARASKYGLLTFIMISAASILGVAL